MAVPRAVALRLPCRCMLTVVVTPCVQHHAESRQLPPEELRQGLALVVRCNSPSLARCPCRCAWGAASCLRLRRSSPYASLSPCRRSPSLECLLHCDCWSCGRLRPRTASDVERQRSCVSCHLACYCAQRAHHGCCCCAVAVQPRLRCAPWSDPQVSPGHLPSLLPRARQEHWLRQGACGCGACLCVTTCDRMCACAGCALLLRCSCL